MAGLPRAMRVQVLGKRWVLRFVKRLPARTLADCDGPSSPNKQVRVLSTLRGKDLCDAVIHELLHAADWHKDEPWVEQVARDIAEVLFKPELYERMFGSEDS